MKQEIKNKFYRKIMEDLPTLPSVIIELLEVILDEKSSVRDVSKIVQQDQTLTSKVLKIVNSAAYQFRGQIKTVDHATTILGFESLKNLLLSVSVFDRILGDDYGFNKSHFWCHSLSVAIVSQNIAKIIGYNNPDEAYVAGLLHDFGKLMIDRIIPEEYCLYLKNLTLNPVLSIQFEKKNLIVTHTEIGKMMCEKWNLPKSLKEAIELHHGSKSEGKKVSCLAAIISVADFICWTQALGSFYIYCQPVLDPQINEMIKLDHLDVEPILEKIKKELEINAKIFSLELIDPERLRKALQKANLKLGKINSLYEDIKKKQEKRINELKTLNRIIYKVRKTLDPAEIIRNVLPDISKGFGFARLIWFKIDFQNERIIPYQVYGKFRGNHPMTTIGCNWNDRICLTLHKIILEKKILHITKSGIRDTNTPQSYLLETLESQTLYLLPIGDHRKVTDILLLDSPREDISISSDDFYLLEILALNLELNLENAKLFQHNAQIAIHDSLTNIYNRRHLDHSLNNEINRSNRSGQPFSIAVIDIDYFKTINDTYGHQVGDNILKDIAELIKYNSRNIDILGRLGGDEFLIILPHTPLKNALIFAEKIRKLVEKYGLLRQKKYPECHISLSIGVAEFQATLDNADRLFRRADKALYQSKQEGRNGVNSLPLFHQKEQNLYQSKQKGRNRGQPLKCGV